VGDAIDYEVEVFTMDDLGNRTKVNVRDGSDVNYVVDNFTNSYNTLGDANLSYDGAGNLTTDKDGYGYQYDYENRVVEINDVNGTTIAEFAYDALGRRIEKKDLVDSSNTRRYYYNDNWQVLCEYNDSDVLQRGFVYGNYTDEVLCKFVGTFVFYVHDHLYSPVALLQLGFPPTVGERYEYDAYGSPYILEPNFAADPAGGEEGEPRRQASGLNMQLMRRRVGEG
jgi:YD repeat-containing protein